MLCVLNTTFAFSQGTLKDGNRKDVDREFALLFSVMDENESWYLDQNVNKYVLQPRSVDKTNSDFKRSNQMHAINGYIYSNGPNHGGQFQMYVGEKVAWYVIGYGNEVDIHTVHFHGNSFIHVSSYLYQMRKMKHAIILVLPGLMLLQG